MRIPITFRIPVNSAGKPSTLAVARIVVNDLSRGIEKISVRIFKKDNSSLTIRNSQDSSIQNTSKSRFPVVYHPNKNTNRASYDIPPRPIYNVKTIRITLSWPSLATMREFISRKNKLLVGIAISLAVIITGLFYLIPNSKSTNVVEQNNKLPELIHEVPTFPTVTPADKNIIQLGGWTKISPPNSAPAYTFQDKINNIAINVSEQQLPVSLQHDTSSAIAMLATNFNATDKFMASNNTVVYVGSSANGAQSVITTKNGLLILIKSTGFINNNDWSAYISSLQ